VIRGWFRSCVKIFAPHQLIKNNSTFHDIIRGCPTLSKMLESHWSSRDRTLPRRNYFRQTEEHPFEFWKLKENDIKHELPLAAMQCPVMNYHLQQRLLLERRPSSREERRLFSDSSCSNTLLLARSTWLLGGLLFAPSPGHGFLSSRYRKSGI
jgi:hypothetical protein